MDFKKKLLSKSAIVFAARIGGAGLMFLVQAVLARLWGAAALGDYLLAIAQANLLAVLLPLGFQTIAGLFAAEYAARGAGQNLRKFIWRVYGHILLPGIPLLIAVGLIIGNTSSGGTYVAQMWMPISIMAVGSALIAVNGALLIGLKRPILGYFADTLFRPLFLIIAFAIAHLGSGGIADVSTLIWILSVSYLVLSLGHMALALRAALRVPTVEPVESDLTNDGGISPFRGS